jgi:hypothetical protein
VILEYLKKYRKSITIKFSSSLGLGCLVFLIIIGGILSNPLLQAGLLAFITLLSPAGFGFVLLGLLLITGLLCTALWLGIEFYLRKPEDGELKHHINKGQGPDLVEENSNYQTNNQVVALGLVANGEPSERGEEIEVDDNSVDDNSIETFEQKATEIFKKMKTAFLQPHADKQAELEVQLNVFRKHYYKLAKIYHPDLEPDESRKTLKNGEFQRLSGIYERVQEACNQLKERVEQQLNPIVAAYQEQNELLHKQNELLKILVDMSSRFIEQIRDDQRKLKIEIERIQQRLKAHDQKFEETKKEFNSLLREQKEEFHNLLSDLREELNREENKEEVDETAGLVIITSLETTIANGQTNSDNSTYHRRNSYFQPALPCPRGESSAVTNQKKKDNEAQFQEGELTEKPQS